MKFCKLILLVLLSICASTALADNNQYEIEKTVTDISNRVMSPFCPGQTLSACPSSRATELRERISGWIEQGNTEADVLVKLESLYGKGVLGVPESNFIGIIIPVVVPILGLLFVFRYSRSGRSKSSNVDSSSGETIT